MNHPVLSKFIVLSVCVAVGGCFKEYSEDFAEEETIVQNAAIGQQLADDVLDIVYQAEILQKRFPGTVNQFPGSTGSCGTISDDPIGKILIVEYGDGCADNHGRMHSGRILVAYAGELNDSLAERTVTFDKYVVNLKKVEGTVTLHGRQILSNGAYLSTRTLIDFKVSFPNGTGVTFNGSHERFWTSGRGDPLATNNRYTFKGSITGVSSSGRAFTQDIVTPVIADFFAVSLGFYARTYGVVKLSKLEGYPDRERTADYGTDSTRYDNTITITTFRRVYGVSAD